MSSRPVTQKAHQAADRSTPRLERDVSAPASQRALRAWLLSQVVEFHHSGILSPAEADGLQRALLGHSDDIARPSLRRTLQELVAATLIAFTAIVLTQLDVIGILMLMWFDLLHV